MLEFSKKERSLIKKLNTPAKVQDYINSLRFNFEARGETLRSPVRVMRAREAHCIEGAILGAYILAQHGFKPYLMLLVAEKEDQDHVIAPFKVGKLWGALSKTNHAVLRYREPVYKNIRELAMSYFHEYFLEKGQKTMRSYSALLDLNIFEQGWEVAEEDLWGMDEELDRIKHFNILPARSAGGQKNDIKRLRTADEIEIKASNIEEYKK